MAHVAHRNTHGDTQWHFADLPKLDEERQTEDSGGFRAGYDAKLAEAERVTMRAQHAVGASGVEIGSKACVDALKVLGRAWCGFPKMVPLVEWASGRAERKRLAAAFRHDRFLLIPFVRFRAGWVVLGVRWLLRPRAGALTFIRSWPRRARACRNVIRGDIWSRGRWVSFAHPTEAMSVCRVSKRATDQMLRRAAGAHSRRCSRNTT